MIHKFPYNGEWVVASDEMLKRLSPAIRKEAEEREMLYKLNPLGHFLPHGRAWSDKTRTYAGGKLVVPPSDYPKEWQNDGVAFLNDWTSDICLNVAPNQCGKSVLGAVWTALRVVPLDPEWPIFHETPVQWHEWTGPKKWVVASYSWDNVTTVWQRYQEFLPRNELGPYASDWGKYDTDKGRQRTLTFGDGRTKFCQLTCGSILSFRCYTQQQMHWEGFESDGLHADEQCPPEKFTGWQRGTTTRGDYTPACFTLTGHVLDDRPDTGAAGWIKRDLWDKVHDLELSRYTD